MMQALVTSPLLRNALTMGASLSMGDMICQCIQMRAEPNSSSGTESVVDMADQQFDFERTTRMGIAGLCVQGPIIHWMYGKADSLFGVKPVSRYLPQCDDGVSIHVYSHYTHRGSEQC
jgi:hypothetical protein